MNLRKSLGAKIWLIIVGIMILALGLIVPQSRINSSILDLLPTSGKETLNPQILEGFNQRLDQQLVWLISSEKDAQKAAELWVSALEKIDGIGKISGLISEADFMAWGEAQNRYKYALLDEVTERDIADGTRSDWIISQLYSPIGGVTTQELTHDPLLLNRSQLFAQQKNAGKLGMKEGWLVASDQGQDWYFIRAELSGSSYSVHETKKIVRALDAHENQIRAELSDFQLLKRGTLYYSDFASQSAVNDISTIGVASFVGIVLLIFILFRSLLPIGLTLLALTIGIMTGTTAVLYLFGEIHIITIVMSTSIIGVSIDYALLFLTERMMNGNRCSPYESRRKLFIALLGALITTLLAYIVLLFAPFAGLQQLAIFTITGLIAVFLTILFWFPPLSQRLPVRESKRLVRWIEQWLSLWQHQTLLRYGVPAIIVVLIVVGVSKIEVDDDVGRLQSLPQNLVHEDQNIGKITGQNVEQQMIIIEGNNREALFKRAEKFFIELDDAVDQALLEGYKKIPFYSLEKQQNNLTLIDQSQDRVMEALEAIGIDVPPINSVSLVTVSMDDWINSPLGENWRLLWYELDDGSGALVVPLEGIKDYDQLQRLADNHSGVHWVDRKQEMSELFSSYRQSISWLLLMTLGGVTILFMVRFRLKQGLQAMLPITLALALALSSLGFFGITLNLFPMMALILVLGMGIDYTLFFINRKGDQYVSMLTIFSAALISELTFGLLAFSQTNAISGFGVVLAVGIFTALLLAPLATNYDEKGVN